VHDAIHDIGELVLCSLLAMRVPALLFAFQHLKLKKREVMQVIKSARVMKKAVAHLIPFIEEEKRKKGGAEEESANAGEENAGVPKISTFCPCDSNACVF
jgi:hypothetical protein